MGRVTEWIDFLNRDDIPDHDEYRYLELFEEIIDNGDRRVRLIKVYKDIRREYRKYSRMDGGEKMAVRKG